MIQKELTCIGCPLGCTLYAEMEDGKVKQVIGNTCPRGELYAQKELTNPTRIVTSTVRVMNGTIPRVSVKTSSDIPKKKIAECIAQIKTTTVMAPIYIGDIIIENVAGTLCNIVATKEIKKIV